MKKINIRPYGENFYQLTYWDENQNLEGYIFYNPPHKKWRGIMLYPSKILKFWVSVRPSISASFPDTNLSSFWPIFFKLCMDIDIGEEWFGIANGLNSSINNRVMVLDWYKNVVSGLTWVVFDRTFFKLWWTLISGRSGLGLQMG